MPAGTFAIGGAAAAFTVARPIYTTLDDGVKVADVFPGAAAQGAIPKSSTQLFEVTLPSIG